MTRRPSSPKGDRNGRRTPRSVPTTPALSAADGNATSRSATSAKNLVGAAGDFERLRLFASALRVAGLEALLSERGPFTIFAPTNRAFEKLSRQTYDDLLADPARLAALLCHHVVPGRVKAPKPGAPRLAMPIAGAELRLSAANDRYQVEDASIVRTNIKASNGVIHAIDTVLFPA
ncbi:MAG TPA: fasciclin domain-containing protein [Gemmatimonadaceae bacterium]